MSGVDQGKVDELLEIVIGDISGATGLLMAYILEARA